jgi:hypothetical protein
VPVVPEGPTELDPVLPDVPPDGAPDMPAPLPEVESVVLPAVPPPVPPMVPLLPDVPAAPVDPVAPAPAPALSDVVPAEVPPLMPDPVVDPPDIEPPLEPVLPVDGEAVVLGVVVVVVEAPGEVVSSVRRSHPATTALNAAVAIMSRVSLDIDCIEISLSVRIGFLSCSPAWAGNGIPATDRTVELADWDTAFQNALHGS